jgi:tetratricopeptide (TPR) repeat protein
MERRADRVAHGHEVQPGRYASALEQLYRENLAPVVMPQRRAIHPHLYDRMTAAGAEPAYPRPAPPPRWAMGMGMAASLLLLLSWFSAWLLAPRLLLARLEIPSTEGLLYWASAAELGDASDAAVLSNLAWHRYRQRDYEAAIAFDQAAVATHPRDCRHAANLAIMLAATSRLDEARQALELAQQQALRNPRLPAAAVLQSARDAVVAAEGRATAGTP